jgi:hypothetical protein
LICQLRCAKNTSRVWTFFIDESGDFPSPGRPLPAGLRLVGGVAVPLAPKEAEKWAENTIMDGLGRVGAENFRKPVHACEIKKISYWLLSQKKENSFPLWQRLEKQPVHTSIINEAIRKAKERAKERDYKKTAHSILTTLRRAIGENLNKIDGSIIFCIGHGSFPQQVYQPSYLEMLEISRQAGPIFCSIAGEKNAVHIVVAERAVAKTERDFKYQPPWIDALADGSSGFQNPVPKIKVINIERVLASKSRGLQVADIVLYTFGTRWRRGIPLTPEVVADK